MNLMRFDHFIIKTIIFGNQEFSISLLNVWKYMSALFLLFPSNVEHSIIDPVELNTTARFELLG